MKIRYGKVYLILSLLLCFCLTGCGKESVTDGPVTPPSPVNVPTQGETFLASGLKIKAIITPQAAATLDPLTFEVYVDGAGNGTGLVGYKDEVYDIVISEDKVYVQIAESVAIEVTDVTGHMIPTDVDVASSKDLASLGFTMLAGKPSAYRTTTNDCLFDVTFGSSDATFDATTIAYGNTMTVTDLITYILSVQSLGYTVEGDNNADPIEPEKGSFWNNSVTGINIHDKVYSIGDFCNPSTYYEGLTPEGITPSYAYNGDNKVEFRHINYQSSDGRTSFMISEGYVQAISTTCEFQFLEVYKGMPVADLKPILGIGLKKAELEEFKPMIEGLEVVKSSGSSGYTLKLGDMTILIKTSTRTKAVSEITITNYIDFLA